MKDENIKEILDKLNNSAEHYILYDYEVKILLDYITNLQTIEQQYSAILSENAELENKITNLQEEKDDYKHKFWEEQELNEYLQDKIDKVAGRAMHIQKTYGYELSDLIFLLQRTRKKVF